MEILPTFQSTPTYVSARLSMKIKNYNLLSSVTVSGVIDWIWIINEVTEVGDGSVTANFAVTLPCFQWLLMGCWLGYTELFSFSRLKLLFLMLGTKVSSAWNFSSKAVKPKFRTLENSGPAYGISETRQELMPYLYDSINLTAPTVRLTCSSKKQ